MPNTTAVPDLPALSAQEAVHLLRLTLVQAECAIKGREHTGFINRALVATEHIFGQPDTQPAPSGDAVEVLREAFEEALGEMRAAFHVNMIRAFQMSHQEVSDAIDKACPKALALTSTPAPQCHCEACEPHTVFSSRMILCATCGNKRCPHATDHRNACTNSNEPGQAGSSYANCTPASAPSEGAADARDAARYRWLLEHYAFGDGYSDIDHALNYGEADKHLGPAIDAAIASTHTTTGGENE